MAANPQASSAGIHNQGAMQPNGCFQAAVAPTNIAPKLGSIVANDRHATSSAAVDMHADYLRTIYKRSYDFQVPRVGNDGEIVPVLQAIQQEATPLHRQNRQWPSDPQVDNSISCGGLARSATAQPIINRTQESSAWYSLRGVGEGAYSSIELALCESANYPGILEVEEETE